MGILADWQIRRDIKITPFAEGVKREGTISYGLTSYGYDARIGYKFKVFSDTHATEIDPKNFDQRALEEVDLTPVNHHKWKHEPNHSPEYICERCGRESDDPDRTDHYYGVGAYGKCIELPNFIRIPPNSFILGETVEEFTIPRDVLCVVVGKSTLARCGLIVNVTPGEPEWTGKWTVEISNTTRLPARVYCGEGIMQCLFIRTDGVSEATYRMLSQVIATTCSPINRETMLKDLTVALRKEALINGLWLGHDASCRVSYADKKGKYQSQTGLTLPTVDKKG